MMIVVHLIKTTTGAAWALRQIKTLIILGCKVHVVLPDSNGLARDYMDAGAIVHILNVDIAQSKNPLVLFYSIIKFRRLIKIINADLVHSHFVGTTLFMRLALLFTDVRRVFQVPGPLHLESKLTRNVEIKSATAKDYWIASCSRTKKYYLDSGISDARVGLSFYGSDFEFTKIYPRGSLRSELNISENVSIVGMVAFCYPPKRWLGQTRGLKGHEDLIDAMSIVLKKSPNVVCVIIGGSWGDDLSYFNKVKEYGHNVLGDNIIFLGTRADVPQLYADIDIAVHPSHSENLGGAAESLILEVPTIASNVGGFTDIIINNVTGLLFESKNSADLADKIQLMLEWPSESRVMATNGRRLVAEALDVNLTAKQVYCFYSGIINE